MSSSIYEIPVDVNNVPIAGNTKILTNDIEFSPDEFEIGGAGLVRVWISVKTDADADTIITITTDGTFDDAMVLNADVGVIKSSGLYRFDIEVRASDKINIRSSEQILNILQMRFDKIIFGA